MRPKIKDTYLMLVIVIGLFSLSIYSTFALFTAGSTINNVVKLTTSAFSFTLGDMTEYQRLELAPGETKNISININNPSSSNLYYALWYEMINPIEKSDDITIGYSGTDTGSISSLSTVSTNVYVVNDTDSNIYLNLGVASSLSSDIVMAGNRYLISEEIVAQAIYSSTDNSLTFVRTSPLTTSDTYNGKAVTAVYTGFETDSYAAAAKVPWNADGNYESITSVVIEDAFNPISTRFWFFNFSNCTSITGLEKINTSSVTDMSRMFYGCSGLTSLDVSGWTTSSVTDMSYMFQNCSGLTSLDVSGWTTSSVTTMKSMFQNCSSLTSLDVSGWTTSGVTDMYRMFQDCSSLTSLDVSGWTTSSVTDMSYMFYGCSGLTSLDVSGWTTSGVTTMSYMFYGCSGLTSLDVSGWTTSGVTTMSRMFLGCSSLTSLDVSGWTTSSVTNMSYMFQDCSSLTSLDVSGWTTSGVTTMSYMFLNCSSLTSLDVSGWTTSSVTTMKYMFSGCSTLTTISLGINWAWVGTDGYLPAPSKSKIDGANGNWYNTSTNVGYAPADIPNNTAATYTAISPDQVVPSLTLIAPTGTSSSSPTVVSSSSYTVTGTATDAGGIASVKVNGNNATIDGNGNYSYTLTLADGVVTTVTVVATDNYDNTSTLTRYVKYVSDAVGPTITVSAPTGTTSSSPTYYQNDAAVTYNVTGTVSDTSGVASVTVNGTAATVSGTSFSASISLATNTTHTITIASTDNAGNSSSETRYVRVEAYYQHAARLAGTTVQTSLANTLTNSTVCTAIAGNSTAYGVMKSKYSSSMKSYIDSNFNDGLNLLKL